MQRTVLALAAFVLMAGFTSISIDANQAKAPPDGQAKAPAVPPPPKKGDAVKVGDVEIFKGKSGFRWRVVDSDGKTIAMPPASTAWDKKEDVIKALDELKQTLNKAVPKDVKE